MATHEENQQMYLGYFASIMVALLAATWLAALCDDAIAKGFGLPEDVAQGRLTSGFFFMVCCANPSALLVYSQRLVRLIPTAAFGFAFGWFLQVVITEVYVGEALARFFMIATAVLGLPIMIVRNYFDRLRESQSGALGEMWFKGIRAINRTQERVIFIVLMVLGFLGFVRFTATIEETLLGLALVVTSMTAIAAAQISNEHGDASYSQTSDFSWEEDTDKDIGDLVALEEAQRAKALVSRLTTRLFPGAIFFGGLTWVAGQAIPSVFPNLVKATGTPFGQVRAAFEIGAVGLSFVMIGVAISALVGLGLLQVISHYARWSPQQLKASRINLLKRFSIRPI